MTSSLGTLGGSSSSLANSVADVSSAAISPAVPRKASGFADEPISASPSLPPLRAASAAPSAAELFQEVKKLTDELFDESMWDSLAQTLQLSPPLRKGTVDAFWFALQLKSHCYFLAGKGECSKEFRDAISNLQLLPAEKKEKLLQKLAAFSQALTSSSPLASSSSPAAPSTAVAGSSSSSTQQQDATTTPVGSPSSSLAVERVTQQTPPKKALPPIPPIGPMSPRGSTPSNPMSPRNNTTSTLAVPPAAADVIDPTSPHEPKPSPIAESQRILMESQQKTKQMFASHSNCVCSIKQVNASPSRLRLILESVENFSAAYIDLCRKAAHRYKECFRSHSVVRVESDIAALYLSTGKYAEAEGLLKSISTLYMTEGWHLLHVAVLSKLAICQRHLSHHVE